MAGRGRVRPAFHHPADWDIGKKEAPGGASINWQYCRDLGLLVVLVSRPRQGVGLFPSSALSAVPASAVVVAVVAIAWAVRFARVSFVMAVGVISVTVIVVDVAVLIACLVFATLVFAALIGATLAAAA